MEVQLAIMCVKCVKEVKAGVDIDVAMQPKADMDLRAEAGFCHKIQRYECKHCGNEVDVALCVE